MENNSQEKLLLKGCRIIYRRTFGKKLCFISVLTQEGNEFNIKLTQPEYVKNVTIGQFYDFSGHFEVSHLKKNNYVCDYMEIAKDCGPSNYHAEINHLRKLTQQNLSHKLVEDKALCKSFKKFQKCDIPNCNFRHFLIEGDEEKLKHFAKTKSDALQRVHDGDPHQSESKMKKLHRNKLFAEFLVHTYGLDYLKDGYLLDIAGGKGMVSFHLLTEYGIKCLVVDPRGINLPKKQRDIIRKSHLTLEERKCLFDENFDCELVKNAKLIFGMHPDEATVSIVEMALKYNKKFAVVPCCVFPTKFSERKLANGEQVIDYTHLITYIHEMVNKANIEGVKESFLKIEGRNKVIFQI